MRRHERRQPVAAALRAIHRHQRDGVGAALWIGRLAGRRGRALHHGPPRRIVARARDPQQGQGAGAHAGRAIVEQRQELRASAPDGRARSAAPLRALRQAIEQGGTPPGGVGVVDRGHGVQDPRGFHGLRARADDRCQLADERAACVGRRRQQAASGRAASRRRARAPRRSRRSGPPVASTDRRGGRRAACGARRRRPASPASRARRGRRSGRADPVRRPSRRVGGRATATSGGEARRGRWRSRARRATVSCMAAARDASSSAPRPSSVHKACTRASGDERLARHRPQRADGLARLPVDQQALGRAPPPQVRVLQRSHQVGIARRIQARRRRTRCGRVGAHHAVDPPAIAPFVHRRRDPSADRSTSTPGARSAAGNSRRRTARRRDRRRGTPGGTRRRPPPGTRVRPRRAARRTWRRRASARRDAPGCAPVRRRTATCRPPRGTRRPCRA